MIQQATAIAKQNEGPLDEAPRIKLDTSERAVYERAIRNIHRAESDTDKQRKAAIEDLEFAYVDQWESQARQGREKESRPCLTIDLMREKLNQVKGEQRQNRPQLKVLPVDDKADPETAEVLSGLIRAILANSEAEIAFDMAFGSAVDCGWGAFRVVTDYEDDHPVDQVIKIEPVQNPFTVLFDPAARRYDKQDSRFMAIYCNMPIEDYKAAYPNKSISPIYTEQAQGMDKGLLTGWNTSDTVRVAEYFELQPEEYEVALLEDGTVVRTDQLPQGAAGGVEIRRRDDGTPIKRTVQGRTIVWYKLNGNEILYGPITFPSKYFPLFFVWGEEANVAGERVVQGMVRPGKDAQRMINYLESKLTEIISMAPVAPWLATPAQIPDKMSDLYNTAAKGGVVKGVLYYTPDPDAPGKPERVAPPSVPTGLENRDAVNKDNLKSTMGIYDSSLGAQSNEISGKAINARDRQSSRGTMHFQDNLARSFKALGTCLVDMIPRIYDSQRVVRILGLDGEPRRVVYGEQPEGYDPASIPAEQHIYDPKVGKYDVTVSVGPSFATQREESREIMANFVQTAPQTAPILIPRIAKSMDFPDSEEIAEELQVVLLPPEIRMQLEALKNERDGGIGPAGEGGAPQLLGPDGMPVSAGMLAEPEVAAQPEQVQAQPDPRAKYDELMAQTNAANALLEFREKYSAMGYTDEEANALIEAMLAGD